MHYILQQIVDSARYAHSRGSTGALSTGESLAAALVLNRFDWLQEMKYTMVQAVNRVGPEWMEYMQEACDIIARELAADSGKENTLVEDRRFGSANG